MNVLSIGNCGFDDSMIRSTAERLGDVRFVRAATARQASTLLSSEPFDLVFVNRILDGDQVSGIDSLSEWISLSPQACFVLLSERADAQAQALANGARVAVGKSRLSEVSTVEQLKAAIAESRA